MPITFFDFLEDEGWEPVTLDPADPSFYWNDGGFMTAAPVDLTATFDGAIWQSTKVEPAFKWRGRRIRAGFSVPKQHHNVRQLTVLVSGHLDVVEYRETGEEARRINPNEFWVVEAGVPYSVTVGPEGARYMECWDEHPTVVETYWHDDSGWKRR